MAEDREEVDQDEIVDAEIVDDVTAEAGDDAAGDTEAGSSSVTDAEPAATEAKPADTAAATEKPARPVVRRKVVSKRVTPKGGGPARSSGPATRASIAAAQERAKKKGHDPDEPLIDVEEPSYAQRYQASAQLPSPTWVPVLMFALLIVGAVVIILNYMGAFGDPSNVRLIIGLVFILGGIITATQYR